MNDSSVENIKRHAKILLIDESFDTLILFRRLLSRFGYEIFITTSSIEAIELARMHKPDLIILETQLSGKDGIEVCRQVRNDEKTQDTAIMFLTVDDNRELKAKAFEAGATYYLLKPFNPREMEERVHTIFSNKGLIAGEFEQEVPYHPWQQRLINLRRSSRSPLLKSGPVPRN